MPSGWSYSLRLTDSEAKTRIAKHIKSITDNRDYLATQWNTRGKAIVSRWKKKSRDKRVDCLKKADPKLFEREWFAALFSTQQLGGSAGQIDARNYRKEILLDYLNIDALKSDPARFLGLLENRVRYTSEQWAPYDIQRLDWCWNGGLLNIDFSILCMHMSGSRYGELTPWNASAVHNKETVGFPRVKLMLEAQELLLEFLRKVVEQLVEGINEAPSVTMPPQVEFRRSGQIALWSTYTNQPFSAPPIFDIDEILSKAQARLNMASDHLWLLQTDPDYLHRYTQLARPPKESTEHIHKTTVAEIYHDIWNYWSLHCIVEACQNVKSMHTRFRDSIHPGQPLPPKYKAVVQELEMLLTFQLDKRSESLPPLMARRPAFQKHFKFDYSDPDQVSMQGNFDPIGLYTQDHLFWLLHMIMKTPTCYQLGQLDHNTYFSMLEQHITDASPPEAARLDDRLYDRYGDFAAIHELFFMVHLHRPMPGPLEGISIFTHREVEELGRPTVFDHRIERTNKERLNLPLDHDGAAALMKVTKAYGSHLTKARLTDEMRICQFDEIRSAMKDFWKIMRQKRKGRYDTDTPKWRAEDVQDDFDLLSADTTEEYATAIAKERQDLVDRLKRSNRPSQVQNTRVQTEWGSTPDDKLVTPSVNSKPKSRADPTTSLLDVEYLAITPREPENPPITVKTSTRRILSMMLSSTSETTAKLVNWDDFIVAMADVGFSARQTTGSEVVFQPVERHAQNWSGRINFHKPHPVAKIDRVMLRAMGKRMTKWFGWCEEMFVVKEK